jgi:SAM-dependent methyltransferase
MHMVVSERQQIPRKRPLAALRSLGKRYSRYARAKRARLFHDRFRLSANSKILDLGGGTGAHIHSVLQGSEVLPCNVYIADVCPRQLEEVSKYGYQSVRIDEDATLPFPDRFFDLVWCSSVIEHVTVPKDHVWLMDDECFSRQAIVRQRVFADEIRRVGKGFWVQTPARSFPIETHCWLPFAGWISRPAQVRLARWAERYWVVGHMPDYHLLTRGHMEALFPDASILSERCLGLTKSWIAVKA